MERQRQEQETFLRAFTAGQLRIQIRPSETHHFIEISGEIKGERLRFVEAMKEATVINVQSK